MPPQPKPEVTKAVLGFIALTDASPLIIAKEKGFFAKHGMPDVEVTKQASWGTTRDNLVLGSAGSGIDGAHILTPMPYLISSGKVTQNNVPTPMYVLARLNLDSQCISVSAEYADLKLGLDAKPFKAALEKKKAAGNSVKAAMTFPGGTHDCWIRYWLAAGGIDPDKDIETIVVPPPQMVANMKVGTMDCFCVGEPWNEQLKNQKIGYTALNTGEIWNKHPEKSFAMRADWVDAHPNATKALLMAVQEAQRWCDEPANRAELAQIVSGRQWFNCPVPDILPRLTGPVRLRQRQGRRGQPAHHEVLEGQRVVPVPQPRALVPGRGRAVGQVQGGRGPERADREGESRGPVARGCDRSSACRPRRYRSRRRADSRRSSTARCSIPANPAAYLASLAIKRSS